jgi:uncharacterized protein YuzE
MMPISLQITYRRGRPFAAYIYFDAAKHALVERSEEIAPEIVVDYDSDSNPVGVEIVSPEATGVDEILGVFDRLGITRPELTELDPLVAA